MMRATMTPVKRLRQSIHDAMLIAFVAGAVCGAVAVLLLWPVNAHAAKFFVNPMHVNFAPHAQTADIQIRNVDDRPVQFTVTAGECPTDKCDAPAPGLVFFPRAFTIAPGEVQLIRLGVRGLAPADRRYAIFLRQVKVDDAAQPAQGVTLGILLGVRILVDVPGTAQPVRP